MASIKATILYEEHEEFKHQNSKCIIIQDSLTFFMSSALRYGVYVVQSMTRKTNG